MSEHNTESEEPIHQAPWVPYVTVGACILFVIIVSAAKIASQSAAQDWVLTF